LVCYQLLRLAMADATSTQPGIDPDRASFTIALQTARDQVIQAAGVLATTIDLVGKIGRAVLDNLLADRRLRVRPPDRQASHLQVQRQRAHHQPDQLQGDHEHRHPHPTPLTTQAGP
jgi:hypothetical protein